MDKESLLEHLAKGERSFCDQDFVNQDFRKLDLAECRFMACSFTGCRFGKAKMNQIAFIESHLTDCDLSDGNMLRTVFYKCLVDTSSFIDTQLRDTLWLNTNVRNSNFTWGIMIANYMVQCDFVGSVFKYTCMEKTCLRNADMKNCDFSLASLRDAYILNATLEGCTSNLLLDGAKFVKSTLNGREVKDV